MNAETKLQNSIRNALAAVPGLRIFRVNVGTGWTGAVGPRWREGGVECMTIRAPRPLTTGLPPGTPDLVGFAPVVVTPEMVGQTLAVLVAVEVKTPDGRVSPTQRNALDVLAACGARAGVARNAAEAVAIAGGVR